MSPKRTILRQLSDLQNQKGSPAPIHPSQVPGFQKDPARYQRTVNELLKDRLIEGTKDEDGRMAISLNDHRAREVRKILRPLWAHPVFLGALLLFAAAASFGFLS